MTTPKFKHAPGAPRFYVMLEHLQHYKRGQGDRMLLGLFERHQEPVCKAYEESMPALNGKDYWKWKPGICTLAEFHGPQFHKGFRCWDVTPSAEDDMLIWKLLGGGFSMLSRASLHFWNAHNFSMETT